MKARSVIRGVVKWGYTLVAALCELTDLAVWGVAILSRRTGLFVGDVTIGTIYIDATFFHVVWIGTTLLAGGVAFALWRADWRRGRVRRGHCPSCGYDRRGLAPQAPCPECGAAGGPSPTPPG